MTDQEHIADLENQIATWKTIHRADQECITALKDVIVADNKCRAIDREYIKLLKNQVRQWEQYMMGIDLSEGGME